jgi:ubiquitin-like 1-activating enzyme E1 B
LGEEEAGVGELDTVEKGGECAQEIMSLRKEANAFKVIRDTLRSRVPLDESSPTQGDAVFPSISYGMLILLVPGIRC